MNNGEENKNQIQQAEEAVSKKGASYSYGIKTDVKKKDNIENLVEKC